MLDVKARDGLSAEEQAKAKLEQEKQGDDLAEEWEQKILGSDTTTQTKTKTKTE